MYQALKRIQRVPVPEGEFNLVINDAEIVDSVLSRLKNSTQRNVLHFEFKEKQDQEKDERRSKKAIKLAKYIQNLPKGIYEKKEIRENVGIDQAHFSDYLKHEKIIKLRQDNIVKIHYRTIERL